MLAGVVKLFDWVQKLYLKEFLGKNFEEDFSSREDFYEEDGKIVFTEKYHKERGYCCGSDCRHCAYK